VSNQDHADHADYQGAPTCSIKLLPPEERIEAASTAARINPANAPALRTLNFVAPDVVITPAHLALLTAKYWGSGGVRLTVGFLDGPAADLRARILSHMNAWAASCNVRFTETASNPQVRIARTAGDGYWSYLGTDVLHIGAGQPTMNLDSFTMNTPDSEFHRVVRHETGHTLGFPHEHMRSEIVARIDREKAITYFMQTQGWSREQVIAQVLTPLDNSALIATAHADPNSIMCYWLPATIMKDGVAVAGGTDIDTQDALFASGVYPKTLNPIDAALYSGTKCYFFKGNQYIRVTRGNTGPGTVDPGYPAPISSWGWPAGFGANGIDAALYSGTKCYFFKGNQYIRVTRGNTGPGTVDPGYPKPISSWGWGSFGANGIDAALYSGTKCYFFKGNRYIRVTRGDTGPGTVDSGYPAPISNWGWGSFGANGIDDALYSGTKCYFFRGNQYIRVTRGNTGPGTVDAGYPAPISNWGWPSF